ncbi:response regulator [Desulfogranum mediterraneum]|uniref:response regulator n=1 Tax=Desulfogranum mediterraneum TaxID=160661 RepID=UPI00040F9A5C|nr:response regulator [Desulfogranum mediterraneum]
MKKTILIVEDEILIGMMLSENMEDFGYTPLEVATTAEEALAAVRASPPDAILMDISLSGSIDGIEAALLIKQHADIPVIFFTGYQDPQLLQRAGATQPVAILDKLGPAEAIEEVLNNLFS